MTTVIDHAIAIPSKQSLVWEQLRDIEKNSVWQTHTQHVQFLTAKRDGRGARWRSTADNGQERVYEITAWYEGLGYEYIIVDGAPFASNRGRIRLQESPEGTIVQWFFTYEMTGFLSGLRNSLGIRRQMDNEIVDSLRQLYVRVKEIRTGEVFTPESSKAYLREAPDVEERALYQPRYPKQAEAASEETSDLDAPFRPPSDEFITEPPLTEDDTRPNPAVHVEEQAVDEPAPDPIPEPDFLQNYPASDVPETQPSPNITAATEMPPIEASKATDTSQISVFEVFGLQKPSETEQVQPMQAESLRNEPPPAVPSTDVTEPEPVAAAQSASDRVFENTTPIVPDILPDEPRRRGLRAALRSRHRNVRKPK